MALTLPPKAVIQLKQYSKVCSDSLSGSGHDAIPEKLLCVDDPSAEVFIFNGKY